MSLNKTTKLILSIIFLFINIHMSTHDYSAFPENRHNFFIAQGIASGDVTDDSVIIWSRSNRESQMNVEYDKDHNFLGHDLRTASANASHDFTAQIKLEGLDPDTLYYYRVWFSSLDVRGQPIFSNSIIGSFRTAPDQTVSKSVNFVVGGDLGGQGFCRRVDSGYSIFKVMKDLFPNFFVFNGDQIYADSTCPKNGPGGSTAGWENIEGKFLNVTSSNLNWNNLSQLHGLYLKHWEYNRNDTHLQKLLQYIPMYSQMDDHEVIDNFGGGRQNLVGQFENRSGFPNLVRTGIDMFFKFSPIDTENEQKNQIYRAFNWGRNLDLFILDTRAYRDSNSLSDTPQNKKALLGQEQLEWLKQSLLNSSAIWKVVSIPNPVTIPNCLDKESGCDSWATDGASKNTFVNERSKFLKFMDEMNIKNVIFVVTDLHFPANILVREDFDDDGDELIFHEFVSGPLSAIPLRSAELDPTIDAQFLYNESRIFSFSHILIREDLKDHTVHLIHEIRDDNGIIRPNSRLNLVPE